MGSFGAFGRKSGRQHFIGRIIEELCADNCAVKVNIKSRVVTVEGPRGTRSPQDRNGWG